MKEAYYQFLDISVLVKTDIDEIIYSLDKIYRFFKKDKKFNFEPDLELTIFVKDNDITNLHNFEIYALTPDSFDGWLLSGQVWANVNLLKKYVKEITSPIDKVKSKPNKKIWQIFPRVNDFGLKVGWLMPLHFHINLFILHYLNRFYVMHGGALAWNDKGIIINGVSGKGKSTLSFALAKAGFTYFTDESILLDPNTLQLYPYPIAPSFDKDTTMKLFREDIEQSIKEDEKYKSFCVKCFLDVKQMGFKLNNNHVDAKYIIFPNYSPNREPELKSISKEAAIQHLTSDKNIIVFTTPEKQKFSINELAERLVQKAECYELITNQIDKTVSLVKNLVSK